MESIHNLIFILILGIHGIFGAYKLCVYDWMDNNLCRGIEVENSNVTCVRVIDSVDCALKLTKGEADFGLLIPEASVLLKEENNTDVYILGEIRQQVLINATSSLEMVAIVRNNISGKFNELRNKKYCHPGTGLSYHLTDHFLKYFERFVVDSSCQNRYVAEQEVDSLSSFFGDSCRPGIWVQDSSLDKRLKLGYPKLCSLCDNPNKCQNDLYSSSLFESALKCLTEKSGDITYVPIEEVNTYFGLQPGSVKKNGAENYSFLCKNETVLSIDTENPCIWGKQPWDLLVARKDSVLDLKNLMRDWISYKSDISPVDFWKKNLRYLLVGESNIYIPNEAQDPISLRNYVNRGGVDDKDSHAVCRNDLRWCIINSIEKEKCHWIANAASTHGFLPYITCVQGHNLFNCLQKIAQNRVDVISIYTEYGYISRRLYNLSTVVFEENSINGYYKILAVLRNDDVNIKSFEDLANKNACFPQYYGLAWIAFINIAKSYNLLNKSCPEKFFGPSCIPGSYKSIYNAISKGKSNTMCSICPPTNSTDPCPIHYSVKEMNLRAIQCLSRYGGQVAFVNYNALLTDSSDDSTIDELVKPNLYKVLCKNGTIVSGLKVDDDCALAIGTNAEIIGRNAQTVSGIDIMDLFLELNRAFGATSGPNKDSSVFRMFDEFKNEKNLLFKETTISLIKPEEVQHFHYINSYQSLLDNITECKRSAANLPMLSLKLLLLILLTIMINFY